MARLKSILLAGMFAATTSVAFAADMPSHMAPMAPPPPPPVMDIGGGWYLRGDVGASYYVDPSYSQADVTALGGRFINESLGGGGFAGAGVGYQFNDWFRADVTGEYRFASSASAIDQFNFNSVIGGIPTPFTNQNYYKGNYSAFVGLLNGYVDLGTFYGITPFVGAGVGFANNRLSGFTDQGFNVNNSSGVSSVAGGYVKDGSKTGLAWALHAGLGYDVTPGLKLELAYRYMNLGEGKTGQIICFCGGTPSGGLKVKDLEAHDIKLAMRWMLAPPPPAPMVMAAPIITKY